MPDDTNRRPTGFTVADLENLPMALGSGRVAALAAASPIARAQVNVLTQSLARARYIARAGADAAPDLGEKPDVLQHRLARAELMTIELGEEIERSTVPMPAIKPEVTTIVGRVTQEGRGVEGAIVHAIVGGRTLGSSKPSARTGAFVLEVPVASGAAIKVRVRAERAGFAGESDEDVEIKPLGGSYVEIALGAKEEKPPPTFPIPDLVGLTPVKARAALDAVKLPLGTVATKVVREKSGLVIAQSPEAKTETQPGRAVVLTFGRSGKDVEDLALCCALVEIQPAFEKSGLAPGKLAEGLKQIDIPTIAKLRDAFADAASLAKRLGVTDRAKVAAFEEALRPPLKAFKS